MFCLQNNTHIHNCEIHKRRIIWSEVLARRSAIITVTTKLWKCAHSIAVTVYNDRSSMLIVMLISYLLLSGCVQLHVCPMVGLRSFSFSLSLSPSSPALGIPPENCLQSILCVTRCNSALSASFIMLYLPLDMENGAKGVHWKVYSKEKW